MRKLRRVKKGVILLSGGMDSAVTLYQAKSRGYKLTALVFDYQQKHRREIESAKKIARLNKLKFYLLKCNLTYTRSSLTDRRRDVPLDRNLKEKIIPSTYIAGRNIIFLSYAFSLAESIGAGAVFIGAHVQDYSGYPDCRPEFLKRFAAAANSGMKSEGIKIVAPLIGKCKKDIVKLGVALKVPFQYTWSCYRGRKYPCRRCDSCRFREDAFASLGKRDPLLG